MVSCNPADIIWTEPKSISEMPTARKVIIRRTGFRTLDRMERPNVVGIHEVNRRSNVEPTRI